LAWLKKWLTKNVKDDVKDRCVFMDQGGELHRSKAIRDLFEKEFGYEMRVTGTGAHHQNGLVERANQTMDKAIRAMLIGAGLPVKFWPHAFRHFLRIKNLALPRRGSMESAHQSCMEKRMISAYFAHLDVAYGSRFWHGRTGRSTSKKPRRESSSDAEPTL